MQQEIILHEQEISKDVIREKYLRPNENSKIDVFKRVARAIASVEKTPELQKEWEEKFYDNMLNGAIGAGRIMCNAGSGVDGTMINCFVAPVGDAIQGIDENGKPGIYEALRQSAETMRRGGGVGYDFSFIRPKDAHVKGTGSNASGPCSYMNLFDQSCMTVASAQHRRGAQMGALNVSHPDIEEFIVAKRTKGRWNNFNVSVGVTDNFIMAVINDLDWELVHKAKPHPIIIDREGVYQRNDGMWVYKTVKARDLWDKIMRSAYDFAEPGILFLDNINKDNNLCYMEKIGTTNPCVTGDTRLATQYGLVTAAELYAAQLPLQVTVDKRSLEKEELGTELRPAVPVFMTSPSHKNYSIIL